MKLGFLRSIVSEAKKDAPELDLTGNHEGDRFDPIYQYPKNRVYVKGGEDHEVASDDSAGQSGPSKEEQQIADFYGVCAMYHDWMNGAVWNKKGVYDSPLSREFKLSLDFAYRTILPTMKQDLLLKLRYCIFRELRHIHDEMRTIDVEYHPDEKPVDYIPPTGDYYKNKPTHESISVRELVEASSEYAEYLKKMHDKLRRLRNEMYTNIKDKNVVNRLISYTLIPDGYWHDIAKRLDNIEDYAIQAFKNFRWSKNYGGPAWAKICAYTINLRNAESLPRIERAIDDVMDLQHNTGSVFNKIHGYNTQTMKELLDFKYDNHPKNLAIYSSKDVAAMLKHFYRPVQEKEDKNLFEPDEVTTEVKFRACIFGFSDDAKTTFAKNNESVSKPNWYHGKYTECAYAIDLNGEAEKIGEKKVDDEGKIISQKLIGKEEVKVQEPIPQETVKTINERGFVGDVERVMIKCEDKSQSITIVRVYIARSGKSIHVQTCAHRFGKVNGLDFNPDITKERDLRTIIERVAPGMNINDRIEAKNSNELEIAIESAVQKYNENNQNMENQLLVLANDACEQIKKFTPDYKVETSSGKDWQLRCRFTKGGILADFKYFNVLSEKRIFCEVGVYVNRIRTGGSDASFVYNNAHEAVENMKAKINTLVGDANYQIGLAERVHLPFIEVVTKNEMAMSGIKQAEKVIGNFRIEAKMKHGLCSVDVYRITGQHVFFQNVSIKNNWSAKFDNLLKALEKKLDTRTQRHYKAIEQMKSGDEAKGETEAPPKDDPPEAPEQEAPGYEKSFW